VPVLLPLMLPRFVSFLMPALPPPAVSLWYTLRYLVPRPA